MRNILRETRVAVRLLLKTPAFTIVALLLLAVGIGANAAIFSVIDSVFLRKFPYKDPDRLVMVWDRNPQLGALIGDRVPTAYPNFEEWARQNTVFESIAGFEDVSLNRTGNVEPERVAGARVSPNFFTVLGVSLQTGTAFDTGSQAGNNHTVI